MKPKTEKPKAHKIKASEKITAKEVEKVVTVLKKNLVKPPPHEPKKVTRAKVFTFKGADGVQYSLTLQQKLFCELFCDLSMNGAKAIVEAGYSVTNKYGVINWKLAVVMARENLLKPSMAAYVTILLDRYGLTDDNLDKQAMGVANQWGDLSAKVRAIDVLYKKRGLYAPDKHTVTLDAEITAALDRFAATLPK